MRMGSSSSIWLGSLVLDLRLCEEITWFVALGGTDTDNLLHTQHWEYNLYLAVGWRNDILRDLL